MISCSDWCKGVFWLLGGQFEKHSIFLVKDNNMDWKINERMVGMKENMFDYKAKITLNFEMTMKSKFVNKVILFQKTLEYINAINLCCGR